jgi:excisionase family DNA binding protein
MNMVDVMDVNELEVVPSGPIKLLLTADETIKALGIKRTTLYHLIATQQIESVKIGVLRRFALKSLEAYIERLRLMESLG